ncbi:hypothetical protein DFJ74DRAFT_299621 [Hyaloraphidium curvatum]|nr:hypothetical protein DFJ74DRAFT_299621 [Hyaloraphidium curvatum]
MRSCNVVLVRLRAVIDSSVLLHYKHTLSKTRLSDVPLAMLHNPTATVNAVSATPRTTAYVTSNPRNRARSPGISTNPSTTRSCRRASSTAAGCPRGYETSRRRRSDAARRQAEAMVVISEFAAAVSTKPLSSSPTIHRMLPSCIFNLHPPTMLIVAEITSPTSNMNSRSRYVWKPERRERHAAANEECRRA